MPSVASQSISSLRPEIATRHGPVEKERPDGTFEAMLDSALPDSDDSAGCDEGARKPARSEPASSGPSDPPAARSTDRSGASQDSKPAKHPDTAPADDQADDVGQDDVDTGTDDAAAPIMAAELGTALNVVPDAAAATAAPSVNAVAVAVPVPTDAALPATAAAADLGDGAADPATTPIAGPAGPVGPMARDARDAKKAAARSAPVLDGAEPAVRAAEQAEPAARAHRATPATPATPAQPASRQADGGPAEPAIPATPATPAHRATPASAAAAQAVATPEAVEPSAADTSAEPADLAISGEATDDADATPLQETETLPADSPDEAPRDLGRSPDGAQRNPGQRSPEARAAQAGQGAQTTESRITMRSIRAAENEVPADAAPHPSGTAVAGESAAKGSDAKPATSHPHAAHALADVVNAPTPASELRPAAPVAPAAGPAAIGLDVAPSSGLPPQAVGPGRLATNGSATPNAPYAAAAYAPVPLAGLAVEIVAHARDGKNRFEIRLDPPELGRIDVHLHVDRDGSVTSRLVVERSETLDLLRRDAPSLERALHNAGLKTGEQGLEFSLRDHGAGRDHDNDNARASRLLIPDEVQPLGAAGTYARRLGLGAGVDIRV